MNFKKERYFLDYKNNLMNFLDFSCIFNKLHHEFIEKYNLNKELWIINMTYCEEKKDWILLDDSFFSVNRDMSYQKDLNDNLIRKYYQKNVIDLIKKHPFLNNGFDFLDESKNKILTLREFNNIKKNNQKTVFNTIFLLLFLKKEFNNNNIYLKYFSLMESFIIGDISNHERLFSFYFEEHENEYDFLKRLIKAGLDKRLKTNKLGDS